MKVPPLKDVTKEEFDAFLVEYPRPLERNVTMICEPPQVNFNDFQRAPMWPESIVALYYMGDPPGADKYYGPATGWRILATRDMVEGDL